MIERNGDLASGTRLFCALSNRHGESRLAQSGSELRKRGGFPERQTGGWPELRKTSRYPSRNAFFRVAALQALLPLIQMAIHKTLHFVRWYSPSDEMNRNVLGREAYAVKEIKS